MRNIAAVNRVPTRALPVDDDGLIISDAIDECDCVYVTPSHQSPTTVTLPLNRRRELLARARASDLLIIEDDYESEMAYASNPTPALKSLDKDERVLYVGSLSKTLAPGLRLGYVVASESLIKELRALRRLILRHPPANNQRSIALFLARGYHESLTKNLRHVYHERCETMRVALDNHLPGSARAPSFGGSSYWVEGYGGLDDRQLQKRAAEAGIIVEVGNLHFLSDSPPRNYFRLGFSSIANDRIEPGIERLARLLREMR
jgi:GntR family transcriptional regulator/MocR family aminotransferase